MILGALLAESQDYAAAESEFEKAIQMDPHLMQAYLRLGKVYETQNQPDQALGVYQKALAPAT